MCMSYGDLIRGSDVLRMQLQMYVASVDDEEVREVCRRGWMELWSYVVARTGIEEGEAAEFFGTGMLVNVLVALGIDEGERCWGGIQQQYGARYPEQAPASAPSPAPN
jgi:hypothetical protein